MNHAGFFLYHLKTSENQRFSEVFRGYRKDQNHEMGKMPILHFLYQILHIVDYSILISITSTTT